MLRQTPVLKLGQVDGVEGNVFGQRQPQRSHRTDFAFEQLFPENVTKLNQEGRQLILGLDVLPERVFPVDQYPAEERRDAEQQLEKHTTSTPQVHLWGEVERLDIVVREVRKVLLERRVHRGSDVRVRVDIVLHEPLVLDDRSDQQVLLLVELFDEWRDIACVLRVVLGHLFLPTASSQSRAGLPCQSSSCI